MRRLLRTVGGAAFLLTTLVGIWFVLLQNSTVAAQEAQKQRVITSDQPRFINFGVQVLVDGRPLTPRCEGGRLYIEAVRGAEYEIRLRNSSPDRVAVALSVDGLNTIDARQSSAWNASKWVIEPQETITITGWQMSSERARRFYFTDERDSYARKLGTKANIGVISAVFFRERRRRIPITEGPSVSSAEPRLRAEASRDANSAGRAATGIGRSVRHEVTWVNMELESSPVAEHTMRYEYSRVREYSRGREYSRDGRYCPEPR